MKEGRKAGQQLSDFKKCENEQNSFISIALFGLFACEQYFLQSFDVVNFRKKNWVLICVLVGTTNEYEEEPVAMLILSPLVGPGEELFAPETEISYADGNEIERILQQPSREFRRLPPPSDKEGKAAYQVFMISLEETLRRCPPAEFTTKFKKPMLALSTTSSSVPRQQQKEPPAPDMIFNNVDGVWEYLLVCFSCKIKLNDIRLDRRYDDNIGFSSNSILPSFTPV